MSSSPESHELYQPLQGGRGPDPGASVPLLVQQGPPGLHTATPDFKTKVPSPVPGSPLLFSVPRLLSERCSGLRCAHPQWNPAVPLLKSLLVNKTIIGFGLGDELVWGGVTPSVSACYSQPQQRAQC